MTFLRYICSQFYSFYMCLHCNSTVHNCIQGRKESNVQKLKSSKGHTVLSIYCDIHTGDIKTYVDLVCAVCDIPVYKSRIQSLHVLFSLYAAFKSSPHFSGGGGGGGGQGSGGGGQGNKWKAAKGKPRTKKRLVVYRHSNWPISIRFCSCYM